MKQENGNINGTIKHFIFDNFIVKIAVVGMLIAIISPYPIIAFYILCALGLAGILCIILIKPTMENG